MHPIHTHILQHKKDAILWQVGRWMAAATDPFSKGQAITQTAELIANIKDMMVQAAYIDMICKEKTFGIKAKLLNDALGNLIDTGESEGPGEGEGKIPSFIDKEELWQNGFAGVETGKNIGYWSLSEKGGGAVRSSNFLIKPVFHVAGKAEESRHIFEVRNGIKTALMDVPSRVLVSLDTLLVHLVAEGSFIFFGSKQHLLRISSTLLPQFPLCYEIKQLGWQREGFFAYADQIFKPGKTSEGNPQEPGTLMEISNWGILEVEGTHFLIAAASKVYSNNRIGEDPFKHLRVLNYSKPKVTFEDWAKQMQVVYGEKGNTGVAYALAVAFRDILFRVNHNFPHLYGYGERSSGKSQWAASVCSLFYTERPAFNVNSGTDHAFFSYMKMFRNAPANLNEVDDKVLKPEWFQNIKGVFDGEGRMRGKMGSRDAIEVQEVESGLILIGQYLSTQDDNSLVSRSCVEAFAEKQYTEQEKGEFMKLTEWQKAGLTGLLPDVLQHRWMVETGYYAEYNNIVNKWRRQTIGEFNQRIFQNWAHLSAMWFLFSPILSLPMAWPAFDDYCYAKATEYSRFIRSSDTLTDFWNTVVFLLDQQLIVAGWDFKISFHKDIKLRDGEGKEHPVQWEAPRKLLYLRLNSVHKLYQQAKNKAGEKNPMTLENLKHYFSSRPYYIGQVKQTQFKRIIYKTTEKPGEELPLGGTTASTISHKQEVEQTITSAFVFDYDILGCELERVAPDASENFS